MLDDERNVIDKLRNSETYFEELRSLWEIIKHELKKLEIKFFWRVMVILAIYFGKHFYNKNKEDRKSNYFRIL